MSQAVIVAEWGVVLYLIVPWTVGVIAIGSIIADKLLDLLEFIVIKWQNKERKV